MKGAWELTLPYCANSKCVILPFLIIHVHDDSKRAAHLRPADRYFPWPLWAWSPATVTCKKQEENNTKRTSLFNVVQFPTTYM